ncbi:MAG: type IV secretion system DNA-binding domain-containing protein [Candidatus Pacebacteria bacterium]|nr:type IV secretion system DNA-binding domain-containing protein [Candidatus Paceibacterota bacterium]
MDSISFLGLTNFRNEYKKFGIKEDDRRRHIYVVGKTGMGKTTLLENLIIADMQAGRGVGVVDPHGELAEKILDFVPEDRVNDVVYFNPSDMEFPIAFNPLEQIGTEYRHLIASGIMAVFKKIWPDVWSARMEYILNNSLLALLEYPGSTLLGIMRILSDKEYRRIVVDNLKDPVVKSFWVNEFAKYTQRLESEATAAIQNKVGQFVTNPLIRNILGQPHSSIDMRKIMDEKKILIVNLSKGRIGEDNSALLGAMIITKLQLAAMSRIDLPEKDRTDFHLYVDEFQNFATDSFATILSEARKYRLDLILAHQYIGQLIDQGNTRVRDAIFGNVGTMISFRVGAEDAEFLEKEFEPDFMINDFVNLPKYNYYIKLMIDGVSSRPFSASTIPPFPKPKETFKDMLIEVSRKNYGTPQKDVERQIANEWVGQGSRVMDDKMMRQDEQSLAKALPPRENKPSGSVVEQQEEQKEFVPRESRRPERERKEVDIADLRKTLEEALGKGFSKEEQDEDAGKEGRPEK